MTNPEEKLLPCPCCRSKNLNTFDWVSPDFLKKMVECQDCRVQGPIEAWNIRPSPNAGLDELAERVLDAKHFIEGKPSNFWKPGMGFSEYLIDVLNECHGALTATGGERGSGWISVEDKLPEERTSVLCLTNDLKISEGWLTNHIKPNLWVLKTPIRDAWEDRDKFQVFCWMPLPNPPEQSLSVASTTSSE